MVRKPTDGKAGSGANRPGLKVVGRTNGAPPDAPEGTGETMFGDKRSGRDRREDEEPVSESRRQANERRTRAVKQTAWWLERDYVESHHFVQKSSNSRSRKKAEDESGD